MNTKRQKSALIALLIVAPFLTGCYSTFQRDMGAKSSLIDYLYPQQAGYIETTEIPHLQLPLRIGVAFTPTTQHGISEFSEVEKNKLATKVADDFRQLDFVSNIEIIPTQYLHRQGSFANLDQLQRMFDIDVMVLLSFDQSVFTDEGLSALTYWTIIGAYTVPGERNDTHTLLDAAVYDIQSRKMLFRAPGTSTVKSRGTLVANQKQRREDSSKSFEQAGLMLAENLSVELDQFQEKLKQRPDDVKVSRRAGYTGSGDNGILFIIITLLVAGLICSRRIRRDQ